MIAKRVSRTPKMVIAILYRALTKEHWEEGPSQNEAVEAAHDWFYNSYGYEIGSASDGFKKILKLEEIL